MAGNARAGIQQAPDRDGRVQDPHDVLATAESPSKATQDPAISPRSVCKSVAAVRWLARHDARDKGGRPRGGDDTRRHGLGC